MYTPSKKKTIIIVLLPFWKRIYSLWAQILSFQSRLFFRRRLVYEQTKHTKKSKKLSPLSQNSSKSIMKTYLYNFDPLKPLFYIVKLGFTWVYIIFLISVLKIVCGYSLEPPRLAEAVLTSTHNLCFEQKYEKYQNFYLKALSFGGEIFNIFE